MRGAEDRMMVVAAAGLALVMLVVVGGGCQGPRVTPEPRAFGSPYPAPKLWAVMPFRNESGTSVVDGTAMADRLAQQLQQVRGIDTLPVNRVLEVMDERRLMEVETVAQAHELIEALGVDGLLVGTVTAWDPYDPPKIGAAVQLYRREHRGGRSRGVDSRRLSGAATAEQLPGLVVHTRPIAQAAGYFDAANGTVRENLRRYAYGRAPVDSATGWRRYLLDMELYGEFVSHELMRTLFAEEWRRIGGPGSRVEGRRSDS